MNQFIDTAIYSMVFFMFMFDVSLFAQYLNTFIHDRRTYRYTSTIADGIGFEQTKLRKYRATQKFMLIHLFKTIGFLILAYWLTFVH